VIKELAHGLDAEVRTAPRVGGGMTVDVRRKDTAA
jgi:hypothetical protein